MKINGGRKLPRRLTPDICFDDLLAAGFPAHEKTSDLWFSSSFCLVLIAAGQTNIAATAYCDVQRWTCPTAICQRICKAHIFDETFSVNSALNAEVFVAAPHAVAIELDLFGERRSCHWVKGSGVSPRELLVG